MTLQKLNNLFAKMTTTDFKLTRTADQTGKTTRNRSTNASFFVITACENSLIPIIFSSQRHTYILFFRGFQISTHEFSLK